MKDHVRPTHSRIALGTGQVDWVKTISTTLDLSKRMRINHTSQTSFTHVVRNLICAVLSSL